MTTTPRIETVPMSWRIASTAAPSPPFLSPRPTQRPAAMAAASVTRTSSMARLRSGASRRRAGRSFIAALSSSTAPGPPEGAGELAPILARRVPIGTGTMQGVSTASPSSSGEPGPPAKPPRSALSMRDLLGAIALLVVVVLALGGLTRGCSFAPGGPTTDPSAGPTVDAPAQLRALAGSTPFALRVPAVPADWRANAVGTERVGPAARLAVRTGYVTPAGRYLRLVQSDAEETELVGAEAED